MSAQTHSHWEGKAGLKGKIRGDRRGGETYTTGLDVSVCGGVGGSPGLSRRRADGTYYLHSRARRMKMKRSLEDFLGEVSVSRDAGR